MVKASDGSATIFSVIFFCQVGFFWKLGLLIRSIIYFMLYAIGAECLTTKSQLAVQRRIENLGCYPGCCVRSKLSWSDGPRLKMPLIRSSQTESAYDQIVPDWKCLWSNRPRPKVLLIRSPQTESAYDQPSQTESAFDHKCFRNCPRWDSSALECSSALENTCFLIRPTWAWIFFWSDSRVEVAPLKIAKKCKISSECGECGEFL